MKKFLVFILALFTLAQPYPISAAEDNTVLVNEIFDDYSPNYKLTQTTVFPAFIVEVNVIGNGRAVLEENKETNNLYAHTNGFSQGFTSDPISGPFSYSMDILEMTGGHSSIMFLRAAKTPAAFYESAECSVEGFGGACGRTGITLNLSSENTLDVTVLNYVGNKRPKHQSQWVSFPVPNVQEGKTNIKVVDSGERIDIFANSERVCYILLSGEGQKHKDIDVNEKCFKKATVFDTDDKEVLSVSNPLVLMENHYVGWATRASHLKFDNLFLSVERNEENTSEPETSNVASETSSETSSEEASEETSEEASEETSVSASQATTDNTSNADDSTVTFICVVIMILSIVASATFIVIKSKKLKKEEQQK